MSFLFLSPTFTAVVVVVSDKKLEARLEKLDHTVRANVAGAARNQNLIRC
jgi:hypothetical protein